MKLSFRPERGATVTASYPTHVEGRRVFLQKLGLVIGGGVLASVLPSCDDTHATQGRPDLSRAPGDATPERLWWDSAGLPDRTIAPGDVEPVSDLAGVPPDVPAPGDLWPDAGVDTGDLEPGDVGPDGGVDLSKN